MLKKTWSRSSWPAVWSVLAILGIPALAEAQTQLFPLAPIQRQRVPCPMEDPVYGQYRAQYFGYFPTCWRSFPPGWGCPNPEIPDVAAAFVKQKRDPLPEPLPPYDMEPGAEPGPGPGQGGAAPAGRGRTPVPALPPPRSPFELDTPAAPAGGATPPQAARSRAPVMPVPSTRTDPVPTPDEKESGVEGSAPLLALPDPVEAAPAPAASPAGNEGESANHEPSGLLPEAVPAPRLAAGAQPPMPGPAAPVPNLTANLLPPPAVEPSVASPAPLPVQAPQRRGPISTLFNGMTSWLRR
jgi:hypothetical protein